MLTDLVEKARPQAEIELVENLGAVVGTHAGPGAVGFFWYWIRRVRARPGQPAPSGRGRVIVDLAAGRAYGLPVKSRLMRLAAATAVAATALSGAGAGAADAPAGPPAPQLRQAAAGMCPAQVTSPAYTASVRRALASLARPLG